MKWQTHDKLSELRRKGLTLLLIAKYGTVQMHHINHKCAHGVALVNMQVLGVKPDAFGCFYSVSLVLVILSITW